MTRPMVDRIAAALLLALTGCRAGGTVSTAADAAAVVVVDAGARSVAERVDAWLRYHAALHGDDADAGLLVRARREVAARTWAGLSEAELDEVEELVAAVVSQRTLARLTGAEALREFERMTSALKPEQRQKVEAAFGDAKARAGQSSLEPERAKFGDEAVSAVLAREAEITAVWEGLLDGRGARR